MDNDHFKYIKVVGGFWMDYEVGSRIESLRIAEMRLKVLNVRVLILERQSLVLRKLFKLIKYLS